MNCFKCGKEITISVKENIIFNDKELCENCAFQLDYCGRCNKKTPNEWMGELYCYDEDEYEYVCPRCYKAEIGKYPHDYKPYPIFHNLFNADRKHCLHIGVELELEGHNYIDFINDVNKLSEDNFYIKEDGSLDEDIGVEVISNPMTMSIAIEQWGKLFALIDKHNMESTCDCGLHIHLDKEYLNQRQISNIDYIINNFTKSVKKIGNRDINNHEWANKLLKNDNEWGVVTALDYKYRAVNFCTNTIELRCFDSTDDWFDFRHRLITIFALVEYAKLHTFNYFHKTNDDAFWLSFNKYIKKFTKKYFI